MPEDIVAQEAVKSQKKQIFKKILIVVVIVIVLIGGVFGVLQFVPKFNFNFGPPKEEPPKEEEESKEVTSFSPTRVLSYRINTPQIDPVLSFINYERQSPVFTPLSVYYLTNDNKIYTQPFFLTAESYEGKSICEGVGENLLTFSQDRLSIYCMENRNNKEFVVRKFDFRTREYKEFNFSFENETYTTTSNSRIISSRDGDQALIYSPLGAYILESSNGSLFKITLPLNLTISKAVYLSNVESALITDVNKVYRVNFSNHKGGIFDVNFIGFDQEQLRKGLTTARLSKDTRRIVFTISDKIEQINESKTPNFQEIIAYNIDMTTAKVSDELNYEEKFLISCKNLVGNKYCIYKMIEKDAVDQRNMFENLYLKEYDLPMTQILRTKIPREAFISTFKIVDVNPSHLFIKSFTYKKPEDPEEGEATPILYSYKTSTKTLTPVSFE